MYKKIVFLAIWFLTLEIKASIELPVIFIQFGDSKSLNDTLTQAKQFNERVILIGDENNKHHADNGIEFFLISNYIASTNYFRTIYKHMVHGDYEEEFSRFARWFVLEEFMKTNNISIAFYLENEVMLYCNVAQEYLKNFNNLDVGLGIQHGFCNGSVSYWNLKAIQSFCNFLKCFYENKKIIDMLKDQFRFGGEQYQDDWPHMANWAHDNNWALKIGNLNSLINSTAFDSSISDDYILIPNAAGILEYSRYCMVAENLSAKRNTNQRQLLIKDIIWNQGIPYCFSSDLGSFVQFKSLKFQGAARDLIKNYKSNSELKSTYCEPYNAIDPLPFYMLGFFGTEKQKWLKNFIKEHNPKIIVELGSWLGATTSFMAFFMPDNSKLYAVDCFDSETDICVENIEKVNQQNIPHISILYHQFLSNIKHYNLCHKIIPIKKNTLEAARLLDIQADLIYINTSNDEELIYQNIMHWFPKLKKNGIICGDNWKWLDVVQQGIIRAARDLGKKIITDNNFWYFD